MRGAKKKGLVHDMNFTHSVVLSIACSPLCASLFGFLAPLYGLLHHRLIPLLRGKIRVVCYREDPCPLTQVNPGKILKVSTFIEKKIKASGSFRVSTYLGSYARRKIEAKQ